jgi:N-carbamoylputrescine amidase
VVIIVPFSKKMAGVYHNSAYIIDTDGSEAGLYRKMHIPDDPHFMKILFYTWRLGFKTIPHEKGKTLICWDQWYPEAARIDCLKWVRSFVLSNSNRMASREKEQYGENQYGAWMNIMKGHAVANGVYVAAANRIGIFT